MTTRQRALTVHAVAAILALLVLVPLLTRWLGGPWGYLASLCVYWLGFCLPVVLIHLRPLPAGLLTPVVARRDLWVLGLLGVQLGAILFAGLLPHLGLLALPAVALALAMAAINGPLEEAAWRGGFLTVFADRRRLGFWLSLALFTAWHVPLALAHGIVYEGGPAMLVGGAAGLGLIWSIVAWRTGSIFWPTIAHFATNAMVFPVLVATNGFV